MSVTVLKVNLVALNGMFGLVIVYYSNCDLTISLGNVGQKLYFKEMNAFLRDLLIENKIYSPKIQTHSFADDFICWLILKSDFSYLVDIKNIVPFLVDIFVLELHVSEPLVI